MLARIWHGKTTTAQAEAYMREYFHKTGLADYQATPGNRGVLVLQREMDAQADLLMITLWESEDDIRAFAGDDISKARYYPDDTRYFSELEPGVAHYEVVVDHRQAEP